MDAVEILVFIAVMGLLLYQKATKNQSKDKKLRQKRPIRPAVILKEEEKMSETVVPVNDPGMSKPDSFYKAALKRKSTRPVSDPEKKASTVVPSITEVSGESIRFRNREDARRAFLYSEIFNRKYD